jgi:hypothetical protein
MRYLVGVLVFVGAALVVALLIPLDSDDDFASVVVVAGPGVLAGAFIGRWGGLWLALLPLVYAIPVALFAPSETYEDLSPEGLVALTLVITVPLVAASLAIGIGFSKVIRRFTGASH